MTDERQALREALTPEEAVIREWVAAMTTGSGSPLPPSQRRAEPLPRRRVLPVVVTLLELLDDARATLAVAQVPAEDDGLRAVVEQAARMGSCSQTHHEFVASAARAALTPSAQEKENDHD